MLTCLARLPASVILGTILATLGASAQDVTPYLALHRVAIPEALPDHPRVFATTADLQRIRADYEAGDAYTVACVEELRARAESALQTPVDLDQRRPVAGDFATAAALAEGYAVTGETAFGTRARDWLLALAEAYPGLETTGAHGRVTESTLGEGPVAVNAAMAYDLIAGADLMTEAQEGAIERDLLRIMAWECGHKCHHPNSSNWRSWALTIIASCGFAIGDRELMQEAINGVWDPERGLYLYGIVQQLTHSIFSDGIHWERSIGYTSYTASALMYVMVAAANSGIDLWHAELPGILGPFEGGAGHEEFGPAGSRGIKAFLDAPLYYQFPNGSLARVGDSSTSRLFYHRIYDLAWRQYGDPAHAWLISRERAGRAGAVAGWSVWRASGEPYAQPTESIVRSGERAVHLRTEQGDRVGLVQDVSAAADRPAEVSGWVKVLGLAGGRAHIRCNMEDTALFSPAARVAEDWQQVSVTVPALPDAKPGQTRRIRLHVFLEGGAGEVVWDDISVVQGGRELVRGGGFEKGEVDGRPLDFWSLIHAPGDLPEGHFSLADDARIGLSGEHVDGCTLFPIGGFAILRAAPLDPEAPAVNLTYGPFGSGHDHPDRLHFDLYALDAVLCPDPGSWGYDNPDHVTWARQTIAHNTLCVDEVSQEPQKTSTATFVGERPNQRVFGVLQLFQIGDEIKAVRATCDTIYDGVHVDRTLCVLDDYVLDVMRVRAEAEHTFDLPLHGPGQVTTSLGLQQLQTNPFAALGYRHFTQVRRGPAPPGTFVADFSRGEQALRLCQWQPAGAEIILARDPVRGGEPPTSCCIGRRRGKATTFVTVLEPYRERPRVSGLRVEGETDLTVTVQTERGEDLLGLPSALDGEIALEKAR